jgi:hypothetical protein
MSRVSAVGIANSYWLDDRGVGVRVPVGSTNFHFSMSFRPAMGSTQTPIQWVPGALTPDKSDRGVKLTTHLQLVPKSRKRGSIYIHSLIRLHGAVLT